MSLACPKCDGPTQVLDTREERRTRICRSVTCGTRFVTVEVRLAAVELLLVELGK